MTAFDAAYAARADAFAARPRWLTEMGQLLDRLTPKAGQHVLDIGCNTGKLLELLCRRHGVGGLGLDVNLAALNLARRRGLPSTIQFEPIRQNWHWEHMGRFDQVTICSTLAHVEDPARLLTQAWYALKPGGELGIVTPNLVHHRLMTPMNWFTGYKGDPTIRHFWTATSLRLLIEELEVRRCNGRWFEVRETWYMGEPPLWWNTSWPPVQCTLGLIATKPL